MADYSLPSLVTVDGTFAISIKNASVAGLTQPTIQTVVAIDAISETLDVDAVTSEIDQLTITVRDDYSVTAYGFWYALLVGTAEILITLDEGAGATHFFYGTLSKESIKWDERFVGTSRIRTAQIAFDAMTRKLLDADLSDWIDDIPARAEATGQVSPIPSKVVTFKEFFASLLYTSTLNASYSADDVSFAIGTPDFKFSKSTTEYQLNELRIATHYNAGGGDTVTDYFVSIDTDYIPKYYETTQDFLSDLCKNLAIVLRMGYSGGRHTLTVMQRRRAYSGTVTFGSSPARLKESTISLASDVIEDHIRATRLTDATKYAHSESNGSILTTTPIAGVEFGVDFSNIFGVTTGIGDGPSWALFSGGNYGAMAEIDEVEPFNYDTGTYAISYTTDPVMEKAVAYYYYHCYATERKRIIRTYGELTADAGAGESHANINILRRTSIDDGTGAANYYANRVNKKPASSEVEVEWIEE